MYVVFLSSFFFLRDFFKVIFFSFEIVLLLLSYIEHHLSFLFESILLLLFMMFSLRVLLPQFTFVCLLLDMTSLDHLIICYSINKFQQTRT